MKVIEIFERYWMRYDSWYDRNRDLFLKELELIRRNVGSFKMGLDVGVGTGRFARELGIGIGVDLSVSMLRLARSRGIEVVRANAENLPFKRVFDLVLLAFTLCFLENPMHVFKSIRNVLKPGGNLVICTVPGESRLAEEYRSRRDNPFYSNAKFYNTSRIIEMVESCGFNVVKVEFEDLKYGRDVVCIVAINEKI